MGRQDHCPPSSPRDFWGLKVSGEQTQETWDTIIELDQDLRSRDLLRQPLDLHSPSLLSRTPKHMGGFLARPAVTTAPSLFPAGGSGTGWSQRRTRHSGRKGRPRASGAPSEYQGPCPTMVDVPADVMTGMGVMGRIRGGHKKPERPPHSELHVQGGRRDTTTTRVKALALHTAHPGAIPSTPEGLLGTSRIYP